MPCILTEVKLLMTYLDINKCMYIYVIVLFLAPITRIYNGNIFYFIHRSIHEDPQSGLEDGPGV